MKRIITFVFSLIVLVSASQAVTVNDVAGVFSGTLTGNDTKEVYILPGVEANTVTFVVPDFTCSSMNLGTLVLANIPMDEAGKLSLEGREVYMSELAEQATFVIDNANSVLAASTAKVSLSVQASKLGESPVAVQFDGTRVSRNYDIVNGGFEGPWTSNEPNGWHSFGSAAGSYASTVSGNTDQFTQSDEKRPGSKGSGSALLKSKKVLIAKANGNCTNGRINAGSMSATDASGNYSFSDPSGYNTPFVGSPDSMVFWAKYIPGGGNVTDAGNQARMNAVITKNARYQDPESGNYGEARIANATINYNATSNKDWQRLAVPFEYKAGAKPSDAAFVLITFSTNKTGGQGNVGDLVYLDDAEMVYNHSLTSLNVDGEQIEFNNGLATTDIVFSQSDYSLATTTNAKHAQTFIGYDASKNQMYVYVVGNNYPMARTSYSLYSLQMAAPAPSELDTEYSYEATICSNETYSDELFQNLSEAKDYTTRIPNSLGGDSIITLTLHVLPAYEIATVATISMYEPYEWRDKTFKDLEPGVYNEKESFKTVAGCDSIFTLKLTVTDGTSAVGEYNAVICEGDSIEFENTTYKSAFDGEITLEQPNSKGGDSIVHLTVTVQPTYMIEEEMTITVGDEASWEGWNLSTMGAGERTLEAVYYTDADCDSIRVLHLTVLPIETAVSTTRIGRAARREIQNGQLYIVTDEKIRYNILGIKVD